jgi:hypothetical protein
MGKEQSGAVDTHDKSQMLAGQQISSLAPFSLSWLTACGTVNGSIFLYNWTNR